MAVVKNVGVKSINFSGVGKSIRNLVNNIGNEIRFPGRRASESKKFVISWPQDVVKKIDGGVAVDMPLEIHEPQLRKIRIVSLPNGPPENSDQSNSADNFAIPPSAPKSRSDLKEIPTPTTPRRRLFQFPRRASKAEPAPHDSADAEVADPPLQTYHLPPVSDPESARLNSPIRPPPASPQRRSHFVLPNPMAVRKEAWRYTTDAIQACDDERATNGYSAYGEPLRQSVHAPAITDPDVLARLDKLRENDGALNDPEVEARTNILRQGGALSVDEETIQKMHELRRLSKYSRLDDYDDLDPDAEEISSQDIREFGGSPSSTRALPPTPVVHRTRLFSPPPQKNISMIVNFDSDSLVAIQADPPQTPSRPSTCVSTNIRTPKGAYGQYYKHMGKRVEVRVQKKFSRKQQTDEQRTHHLDRWTDERLREERAENREREVIGPDGTLWKSAYKVLGISREPTPVDKQLIIGEFRAPRRPPPSISPPPDESQFLGPWIPPPATHPPPVQVHSETVLPGTPPYSPAGARKVTEAVPRLTFPMQSVYETLISQKASPPDHIQTPFELSWARYAGPGRAPIKEDEPPPWYSTPAVIPVPVEKSDLQKSLGRRQTPWEGVNRGPFGAIKPEPLSEDDAQDLFYRTLHQIPDFMVQETELYYQPFENYQFKDIDEMVEHLVKETKKIHWRDSKKTHTQYYDRSYFHRILATKEFIPFPAIAEDIYEDLQVFRKKCYWKAFERLWLRPLGQAAFKHGPEKVLVFLSAVDDALYLWSKDWDEHLYGVMRLVRGGRTLAETEVGILSGLHIISFEEGGWMSWDEIVPMPVEEDEWEEDIYGWDPPKRRQPQTQTDVVMNQMAAAQM